MNSKFLIIFLCFCFVVIPGCKTIFGGGDKEEFIELKANPATLTLSDQSSTTVTLRIFDAGSKKGYMVEFSTTDGGYFSEDEIHLFGQSSTTTQFYPADLTGGASQKNITIRARVQNLETYKEYTGEVKITVRQ